MTEAEFTTLFKALMEEVLKPYVKEMVTFEADRIGLELVKRFKTLQYGFIDGNHHLCKFVEDR